MGPRTRHIEDRRSADVFTEKSSVADFFIRPPAQQVVEDICKKYSDSREEQHESFAGTSGKTVHYYLLGGHCYRRAVFRKRPGVWINGSRLMRFVLYELGILHEKCLHLEDVVPSHAALKLQLYWPSLRSVEDTHVEHLRKKAVLLERMTKPHDGPQILALMATQQRPNIGPELVTLTAAWARCFAHERATSACVGPGSWHIRFLRWALLGRVAEFSSYLDGLDSEESAWAKKGIETVYNKVWPHNAVVGPMFGFIYGWLQIELGKPGERRPRSMRQQQIYLEKEYAKEGKKVTEWDTVGGSVFVVAWEKTATELGS